MPDLGVTTWKVATGAVGLFVAAAGLVWRPIKYALDQAHAAHAEVGKAEQRILREVNERMERERQQRREDMAAIQEAMRHTVSKDDLRHMEERLLNGMEELQQGLRDHNHRIDEVNRRAGGEGSR